LRKVVELAAQRIDLLVDGVYAGLCRLQIELVFERLFAQVLYARELSALFSSYPHPCPRERVTAETIRPFPHLFLQRADLLFGLLYLFARVLTQVRVGGVLALQFSLQGSNLFLKRLKPHLVVVGDALRQPRLYRVEPGLHLLEPHLRLPAPQLGLGALLAQLGKLLDELLGLRVGGHYLLLVKKGLQPVFLLLQVDLEAVDGVFEKAPRLACAPAARFPVVLDVLLGVEVGHERRLFRHRAGRLNADEIGLSRYRTNLHVLGQPLDHPSLRNSGVRGGLKQRELLLRAGHVLLVKQLFGHALSNGS